MTFAVAALRDLAIFDPSPPRAELNTPDGVEIAFVPMAAVSAETGTMVVSETRLSKDVLSGFTYFQDRDLLVAKITPCFENGKIAQASIEQKHGFGSTEFHVVRPDLARLDARYLLHFLRLPWIRSEGERKMTGSAGQRRVPRHFLEALEVPIPPVAEQRRIAAILDQAEALRTKRRQALAKLDTLAQSLFFKMFDAASRTWPTVALGQAIETPLRNGLSPSKSGSHEGTVLTLSAITGARFDGRKFKNDMFAVAPPVHLTVQEGDFLICRGNGNLRLVGKGHTAVGATKDVLFPDTIIATRVSPATFDGDFFSYLWNSPLVRAQIEQLARTTNGTYKVNQSILEGISLMHPPLSVQIEFGRLRRKIGELTAEGEGALRMANDLEKSLQHRAFRGEL